MNSVLITGCAGFIGSTLTEKLLDKGYFVVGIDNLNDYYNPLWKRDNIVGYLKNNNFNFVEGTILDINLLESLFKKNNFSCVIHLAARAGVRPSILDPLLYEDVNVKGTLNMLECAKKFKTKKFIFGSSSSVYGNQSKVPFTESESANMPISPYAATKKAGEMLCYTYSHLYNLSIICLRFFTVYGPKGRPDMAPYLFTEAILKKNKIKMFGNGLTSRDYTYVDDIVDGIISAIRFKSQYEIFNLGNSHPITLNKFISTIETITGNRAITERQEMQPGDVEKTFADIRKAKKYLDYEPRTSIYEGLSNFVEWFKKNRLKDK